MSRLMVNSIFPSTCKSEKKACDRRGGVVGKARVGQLDVVGPGPAFAEGGIEGNPVIAE